MSEGFCVSNPETCDKTIQAGNIISIACYIVRTFFTVTVIFLVFKRRQFTNMFWLARLAFVGYILQWLFITIYMVCFISLDKGKVVQNQTYFDVVWGLSFYEIHWLIAAHYLRVACLLRLLFVRHSQNELQIM